MDWKKRAESLAQLHNKYEHRIRWEVDPLFAEHAVYLFNNWPHKNRATARDAQLNEIRRQLAAYDIFEVGYGEFPKQGPSEGYSCVCIFDADESMAPLIRQICESVFSSRIGWDAIE